MRSVARFASRPGAARVLLPGVDRVAACELLAGGRRSLCAEAAARRKNAYILLGLQPGATAREIKQKYYALAKQTHPDVIAREAKEAAARAAADMGPKVVNFGSGASGVLETDHLAAAAKPTVVPFLEVQAAYDILMDEDSAADAKKARTVRAGAKPSRARTLGEVLCDRLRDEPEVCAELWEVRWQPRAHRSPAHGLA